MKSFVYAVLICLLASLALFATLSLVGVSADAAKTVALGAFALLPKIREEIVKSLAPTTDDAQIQSFGDYSVGPWRAVGYSALVAFAAPNALSALVGLAATLASVLAASIPHLLIPLNLTLGMLVFFACGNWIGRRSSSNSYLWSLLAAISYVLLSLLATYALLSNAMYETFFSHPKTASYAAHHFLFWLTQSLPVFLLGTYVGKRQRLHSYLAYLAKHLDARSQAALVELAHEEAVRLKASTKARPSNSEG